MRWRTTVNEDADRCTETQSTGRIRLSNWEQKDAEYCRYDRCSVFLLALLRELRHDIIFRLSVCQTSIFQAAAVAAEDNNNVDDEFISDA